RHTRFSRDWSSDVCSSDLRIAVRAQPKKVITLARRDQLERGMLHAMAVHDLRPGLEFLAPGAVQPLVLGFEQVLGTALPDALERSEERRVGKEGSSRWSGS